MVLLPLQSVALPEATDRVYEAWLEELGGRLGEKGADWYRITRDVLYDLYYPGFGNYEQRLADPSTSPAARVSLLALDPRNITLEPEYYADVDPARFARVKPLLWLWYSFDRTPLGAQNVHVASASAGSWHRISSPGWARNFKCFQFTEFSYGYNLEVGDDVVVHRYVLLDDRGGIVLGDRVSISDYANIYSHTHSIVDQKDVTNAKTVLEDDVRITYHATVLAGVRVGRNAMVGAVAVATKDVRPVPRERRHPRQVHPGEAQRAARGLCDRTGHAARRRGAAERWPARASAGTAPLRPSPRGLCWRARSSPTSSAASPASSPPSPASPARSSSCSRAWRREWELPLHVTGATMLGVVAWVAADRSRGGSH